MGRRILSASLASLFIVMATGCGTLFYNHRRDEKSSKHIDPAVMALDCCGFLFGIIPGVIALVLDFNNNTIYYTDNEFDKLSSINDFNHENMIALHVDGMSDEEISKALSAKLGKEINIKELKIITAD